MGVVIFDSVSIDNRSANCTKLQQIYKLDKFLGPIFNETENGNDENRLIM